MKKRIFFVFTILCLIFFSVVSFAHQGRTDSNGGHMNHATGEYHYHHGYSAHDHYDMDGDGIKDCPYEKKQQTPSYSGGYTSPSYSSNSSDSVGGFFKQFFTVLLLGSFAWFIVAGIISKILSAAFKEMGDPANLIVSIIITLIFVIITAAIMAAS
jgi:hypothetical protein